MENKNEEQFILMKEEIENNKQESKDEMKDVKESIKKLTTLMMDQTNISKSSPAQKDTSTPPDPTTTVQTNRRAPPLEGGHSKKILVACGPSNMRSAHQDFMSSWLY